MNLADILVAGHLSRHSSDSTSSVSMMIKALRWGYKQLQIQALVVAFGSLLNSFQTKIPHDRRESLPFSLYVLSQFERHILVRETSQDEILILGAFYCFFSQVSDLRTYSVRHQHLCSGTVQSSEDWHGGPRLPQQEPLLGQWQQVSCQLVHTTGYINFSSRWTRF